MRFEKRFVTKKKFCARLLFYFPLLFEKLVTALLILFIFDLFSVKLVVVNKYERLFFKMMFGVQSRLALR